MSNSSKICLVIAFISALIMGAVYVMIGAWIPVLYFFLFAAVVSLGLAVVFDWRLYFEFFTLRTTKHGMNMGVLILLTVAALVCVNYLGIHYNKTFDLTAEKLYSLSDQTKNIIRGLPKDIDIKVFYKGPTALTEKSQIQKVLDLYKDFNSKVKIRYFNSYTDQAESAEYLTALSDKEAAKAFAFVEIDGKRIRVEAPFDENQFTGAIVKATRRGEKKIYFLKGHGERDLESDNPDGLKSFKESLEGQAFKVESWSLVEKADLPTGAEFIAIIGPKTAYLEPELAKLREYAQKGGRLLIGLDPGQRHNLAGFLKGFGIEFLNNYIISFSERGATPMAVGVEFSGQSKITQDFQAGKNVYSVFDLASEIKSAPAAEIPNGLKVKEIVKSSPYSLAVNEIKQSVSGKDLAQARSYSLAIEVSGRLDKPGTDGKVTETNSTEEKDKVFEAVVFGDSDFVSNQSLFLGVNRDLALNTAADLAHETDLIGSRPKSYKGTVMDLSRYQQLSVILGGLSLPIFLLITSGVTWFRRRGA